MVVERFGIILYGTLDFKDGEGMDQGLREIVKHGTEQYAYAQYHIYGLTHPFYMALHWHEEIEIIYVKSGTLHVTINNEEYEGKAGDIFWVNPTEIHHMATKDLSTEHYTLVFPIDFISFKMEDDVEEKYIRPFREGKIQLPHYISEHALYKQVYECILNIIESNELKREFFQLETKIMLLRVMYLIFKHTPTHHLEFTGKNLSVQRDILSYIDRNYTRRITLAEIAEEFHMSEKYFSRFFKNNFQMTFIEYVNSVRLEKAATLLSTTDMLVTEVALQCGYSNISYFIRSFKKAFGNSPHVFKNS